MASWRGLRNLRGEVGCSPEVAGHKRYQGAEFLSLIKGVPLSLQLNSKGSHTGNAKKSNIIKSASFHEHHQIWCEKETRKDFSWQMLRDLCVGHFVFGADFFLGVNFEPKIHRFFDGIWRFHWTKPREGQSYKRCYATIIHWWIQDERLAVLGIRKIDPFFLKNWRLHVWGVQWFWSISHLYKELGPGSTNFFIPSRKEVVDHLQWERFFFPKSLPKSLLNSELVGATKEERWPWNHIFCWDF